MLKRGSQGSSNGEGVPENRDIAPTPHRPKGELVEEGVGHASHPGGSRSNR